jgi:hypothetical protein
MLRELWTWVLQTSVQAPVEDEITDVSTLAGKGLTVAESSRILQRNPFQALMSEGVPRLRVRAHWWFQGSRRLLVVLDLPMPVDLVETGTTMRVRIE